MGSTGTTLTFFNGTETVGGVQLLVSAPAGKVLFDLGVVGNPAIVRHSVLFHDFVSPDKGRELFFYLRAGMAPPIEGLYREDLLGVDVATIAKRNATFGPRCAQLPLISDFEAGRDRVFISHLHDDHAHLIPYLSSETVVLMSADSALLHSALVATGLSAPTEASIEALLVDEARAVGELTVETVPVDHDIPGASGLYIEAGDTSLFYTGDWRLHGARPELMESIVEKYAGRVDVLITEGSTARSENSRHVYPAPITEAKLAEDFAQLVGEAAGTVYCTFHEQNIERQLRVHEAARASGRHLVVHPHTHALWSALSRRGVVSSSSVPRHVWRGSSPSGAEGPVAPYVEVSGEDVRADRNQFVCEVRVEDRWRLLDADAGPGDRYVHMNGAPFGSSDPGWPALVTWLNELGIELSVLSSHGHATEAALLWFADELRPKLVVPVHSNEPGAFPSTKAAVRPARRGEVICVG